MIGEVFFFIGNDGQTRASEIDNEGNETIRNLTVDEDHALYASGRNSFDASAQAADDLASERGQ